MLICLSVTPYPDCLQYDVVANYLQLLLPLAVLRNYFVHVYNCNEILSITLYIYLVTFS